MALKLTQQKFLDISIHKEEIKRALSSPHEYEFKNVLDTLGKEGRDWFHQHPFYNEDAQKVFVADFTFLEDRLVIELDGQEHKRTIKKDLIRDKFFRANGYEVIRIPTPLTKQKMVYWKVFIQETLKVIRQEKKHKKNKK